MSPTEYHLPADLDAAATSRRLALQWMGDSPRSPDAILAVSELVANAVLHGGIAEGDTVVLRFRQDHGVRRVAVSHRGQPFTPVKNPDSARGLSLVEAVVDRWGVDRPEDDVVVVWFEIDDARADRLALR